jgi:tRNA(fMet)-specific endonuclease VapC
MAGSFLLDTVIVIALFNQEGAVVRQLAEADAAFVSVITIGELYFGALRSSRTQENLGRIDRLVERTRTVECDAQVARLYGEIRQRLAERGTPIPTNDMWIAATARRWGLALATRDDHFDHVEDLTVVHW